VASLDWIVIAVYLASMLALAWWLGRAQGSRRDYYLGGGTLPGWALAVSIIATQCSTNSLLGAPAFVGFVAGGGLRLAAIRARGTPRDARLALLFVPVFNRQPISIYSFSRIAWAKRTAHRQRLFSVLSRRRDRRHGLRGGIGAGPDHRLRATCRRCCCSWWSPSPTTSSVACAPWSYPMSCRWCLLLGAVLLALAVAGARPRGTLESARRPHENHRRQLGHRRQWRLRSLADAGRRPVLVHGLLRLRPEPGPAAARRPRSPGPVSRALAQRCAALSPGARLLPAGTRARDLRPGQPGVSRRAAAHDVRRTQRQPRVPGFRPARVRAGAWPVSRSSACSPPPCHPSTPR
jgi:hypothetical protein